VSLNRNRFNVPQQPDFIHDNLSEGGSDGAYYLEGGDWIHGNGNRIEFTSIERIIMYFRSDSSYSISTGNGDDQLYAGAGYEGLYARGGNDLLVASGLPDRLYGGAGNDVYYVNYFLNQGYDVVGEETGEGFDIVYAKNNFALPQNSEVEWLQFLDRSSTEATFLGGSTTSQVIWGNNGDNTIDGKGGGDVLYGYLGNDIYYVASTSDVVVELAGEGTDIVYSSSNHQLLAGMSIEQLGSRFTEGSAGVNLAGNELSQTIVGDKGNHVLDGVGGGDILFGYFGNDTYVINASSDSVLDQAGMGADNVYTRVNYALDATAEIEFFSTILHAATDSIYLIGNAYAQTICGNAGANQIDGNGGGDLLLGFGGNDSYYVTQASDVVIEAAGEGNDALYARTSYVLGAGVSIEFLSTILHSATTAIDLKGNAFDQVVFGNAGVNRLDGGGGNDTLNGLDGADTFAFTTAPATGIVVAISDFLSGSDRLELDDSVFTALAPGALAASAFVAGTAAQDADDRIIFDAATGALLYDSDGTGSTAAIQFASLQPGASLTSADIFVI
jgi:Ca2+-binding RTX toxin-like protein